MINLIYGGKGSGKTTRLFQQANCAVRNAKGYHIYIDKDNDRMHDLDHAIKLVNVAEYSINGHQQFLAFVKGMVAVNYDIETIYLDNLYKIVNTEIAEDEDIFTGLAEIATQSGVSFVVTVPLEVEQFPEFLKKYL